MAMDYKRLGRSDISVSEICLGTMTWGVQNSEAEAFQQMDYALEQGVNFFDTAEMYPVRQSAETYGRTEEIIGNWLAARGCRDKVVIATKIVGPGGFPYIRSGKSRHNREHITQAVDASLRRLRCDHIDLYQLHWPDRSTNTFGKLAFEPKADEAMTPFEDSLDALEELVRAGKLRSIGLSNENPWGVMKFIALAEAGRGPRMVSVQNPYSLLNRSFETRLSEVAIREDCGLLAYAPIAAGALSGKYLDGPRPEGARLTLWPDNRRYQGPQAEAAVRAYVELAVRHGLDPAQMALAFVLSRPFLTSAIIGATSMEQLKIQMASKDLRLAPEVYEDIEALHQVYTYPCP
jgi:aryl-alcohol dehydrogenase-like predicted oxidoreductase